MIKRNYKPKKCCVVLCQKDFTPTTPAQNYCPKCSPAKKLKIFMDERRRMQQDYKKNKMEIKIKKIVAPKYDFCDICGKLYLVIEKSKTCDLCKSEVMNKKNKCKKPHSL
jgi:hypothetical protein